MNQRVQSVAVVGSDAPAWLAAAALRRALGGTGLRVQVVELESRQTEVDAYVALPSLGAMHRLLGLDERLLFSACDAVPMVAQRFSNWAKAAPPFMLSYDDEPPPAGDLLFHQYWAKGALEGLRVGLEDFSLGSVCARLGRVPVAGAQAPSAGASYGYHLDARSYSKLVAQLALRLGAEVVGSGVRNVNVEGDRITCIDLHDGTRVTADLYIDATGAEARLIGRMPNPALTSWAAWLPCNRILAASGPRLPSLPAFSQISAFAGGWVGLFPLQNRTAIVAAYRSTGMSDQEVADQVSLIARMRVGGDAIVSPLEPGIRERPWVGNCIAVGDSAMVFDPIDGLALHAAQGCISHLITLFPTSAHHFPEAEAYNRSLHLLGANLRNFQTAPYKLNCRFDDPLWDAARDAEVPSSLVRKINLFSTRAIVPLNDEESFAEQSWAALLVGCGVRPKGYDPRIDAVADDVHIDKVQQRLRHVAELARQMPSVEQFIGLDQNMPEQVRQ